MTIKKELNDEELDKVNGGTGEIVNYCVGDEHILRIRHPLADVYYKITIITIDLSVPDSYTVRFETFLNNQRLSSDIISFDKDQIDYLWSLDYIEE